MAGRGKSRPPEVRAKISASMKGKRNRLGCRHTDEAKAAISRGVRRHHVLKKAGLL
jgi:NUMOD3 motif